MQEPTITPPFDPSQLNRADSNGDTVSSPGRSPRHDNHSLDEFDDPMPTNGDSIDTAEADHSDDGSGSDSEGDGETHIHWTPIGEDPSVAEGDELKNIQAMDEKSALDDDYWRKRSFTDLHDEEVSVVDTAVIHWTVDDYNGTREKPNRELLRYSPSVRIGGLDWRIKLYPKGFGHERLAVFLECQSLVPSADGPRIFEDGGDCYFTNERLPVLLAREDGKPAMRRRRIPVQLGILMYNPAEPRTYHHTKTSHGFHLQAPDGGCARFGGPLYTLGHRAHLQRTALLQKDTLAFAVHFRLLKEPTGLLFDPNDVDTKLTCFDVTGIHGFEMRLRSFLGTSCRNAIVASTIWLLLAPVRQLLYQVAIPGPDILATRVDFEKYEPSMRPVICALQRMLFAARSPERSYHFPTEELHMAAAVHGVFLDTAFDVAECWQLLADLIEKELAELPELSLKRMFGRQGMRCKLTPDKLCGVRNSMKQLMECGKFSPADFPDVLQIELPRWQFDQHRRRWSRSSDSVKIDDVMRLQKEKHGHYQLFAIVEDLSRGERVGERYSAVLRPDGKHWYRTTLGSEYGEMMSLTPLTGKDVELAANRCAYLLVYVRLDLASKTMNTGSKLYDGGPEKLWTRPLEAAVNESTKSGADPASHGEKQPSQEVTPSAEDTEMADADVTLQKTVNVHFLDMFCDELLDCGKQTISFDKPWIPQIRTGRALKVGSEYKAYSLDQFRCHGLLYGVQLHPVEVLSVDVGEAPLRLIITPTLSFTDTERLKSEGKPTSVHEYMSYLHHRQLNPASSKARNGEGVHDYYGGELHRGAFSHGKYHGSGHHIYHSGDVYDGQYRRGKRHGKGFQTFQNGDTYDGEWCNDEMHGEGTMTRATTGNTFKGLFKNGKQSAPGVTTWRVPDSNARTCQICYENEQNAVFLECGHVCACMGCAVQVDTCPSCRKAISRVLKLYFMTD